MHTTNKLLVLNQYLINAHYQQIGCVEPGSVNAHYEQIGRIKSGSDKRIGRIELPGSGKRTLP